MFNNTPLDGVQFGRIAPTISVSDIARAEAFYVGKLGMVKVFENPPLVS